MPIGGFAMPKNLIRIDIDAAQLARRPATLSIQADCGDGAGGARAPRLRRAAATTAPRAPKRRERRRWPELTPICATSSRVVEAIRDALPGAIIVGDSTQPVYAANLYYDHDRPGGWFNAATGFGALGFGPPAAIGAALAAPDTPVVCLTGDGGFQFTMPELGAALDAGAPVIFVVWNNRGYREIETSMLDAGVEPVGVSPAPPDFLKIADAYGIAAERLADIAELAAALAAGAQDRPAVSHRDRRRLKVLRLSTMQAAKIGRIAGMNADQIDHRAIIASLSASDRALLTGLTNRDGILRASPSTSARSCCSARRSSPHVRSGRCCCRCRASSSSSCSRRCTRPSTARRSDRPG